MHLEQPQAIRTVFFDVGSTLLSSYPSDLEICRRVCARRGLHLHRQDLEKQWVEVENFFLDHARTHRHTWASRNVLEEFWLLYYKKWLRPLLPTCDEHTLHQLVLAIIREYDMHTSWRMYPDVLPTLQALHASGKYTLGAISDWSPALGTIFQHLRLNRYFDCLLVSSVTGHAKPSVVLYETALRRANAVADYAIHVGDSYTLDVLGARAVGITPVLLDRKRRVTQSQVDCLLIHSLHDLLALLEIENKPA